MAAGVDVGFDFFDPAEYLSAARWLFAAFAGFRSIEDQVVATLILAALLVATSFTGLVATLVLVPLVAVYGFGVAALRLLVGAVSSSGGRY